MKKSSSVSLQGIFHVLDVTFVPCPVAKDQMMKVLDYHYVIDLYRINILNKNFKTCGGLSALSLNLNIKM